MHCAPTLVEETTFVIGLTEFDAVVDCFGEEVGRAVLAELADRLRRALGPDVAVVPTGSGFVVRCRPTRACTADDRLTPRIARVTAAPVAVGGWKIPVLLDWA